LPRWTLALKLHSNRAGVLTMKLRNSLLLFSLAGAVGCSPVLQFSSTEPLTQSGVRCQPGQITTNKPTKFIFVVDQSGSNVNGPYEHPGQSTDKLKSFRYGVIKDFFEKHGSQPLMSWGFVSFNGTTAHGLIHSGDPQTPTFSDEAAMDGALTTFLSTTDQGDTPQRAALHMVRDMIQRDLATATVPYQYRVALLTDGYPTDYCPGGATSCPGQMLEGQVDSDVQSIVSLAPQSVQISTVYYGVQDAEASGRLQRMAVVGGGQFVDSNVSKVINLDNVIQVPTQTCAGR
jgi:hypothetical protein